MYIPTHWARASDTARLPDGNKIAASAWGWGDNEKNARSKASERLSNTLDRLRRGEGFPEKYSYGARPVREEILDLIGSDPGNPDAIVTRNRHGVQVLNTAHLLFLDIDLVPPTGMQRLLAKIGFAKDRSEAGVLIRLRETLRQNARATFRIYRTAAGLRVMAIDRPFDPDSRDTLELMTATHTDPAFIHLCKIQKSFRARLTPKPWRCNCSSQNIAYPRESEETQRAYASWLREYEKSAGDYATCHYLETVGAARPASFAMKLIEIHDRVTRCDTALPLA